MDPPFIPFNKPAFFQDDFNGAIQSAVSHGQLSGDGVNARACDHIFQSTYGYARSLLTPSCTAALEMAALILDLGPDDEVIVPSFTFVTSASAFGLRGAKLVFADSEEHCPNVSVEDILEKVTNKTKAIIVVHYAGIAVDVHKILEKTRHSIPVVEDCAHAICSTDLKTGDYVGKAGCLSTFSFHETKNACIGEGGLLVVNDLELWHKAQIVREKGTNRTDFKAGKASFYTWIDLGSSYLMSEVDAAVLVSVLKNLEKIQKVRRNIWDTYENEIISPHSAFKKPSKEMRANAHMYFLKFHSSMIRSEFCAAMKDQNIFVATHYVPLDTSPYVQKMREKLLLSPVGECKQAALWSKCLVRLPLYFDLTDDDLKRVVSVINGFSPSVNLVPAEERYWEAIRQLRNNNRECFTHKDEISKDVHKNFMRKHCSTYRVAVQRGQFVGFIGHVNRDARLATNCRGKGIGRFMWETFTEEFGDLDVKVLADNERSLAFFSKLGYTPQSNKAGNGDLVVLERS